MKKQPKRNHPKYETLKEYFDRSIKRYKNRIAFVELKDNSKTTFEEFGNNCIYGAWALNKIVNNKKTNCAIIAENSVAYMVSYFSTILSNNVAVLIAGDLDEETLIYQINHADCKIIFISNKHLSKIESIKKKLTKVIVIDDEQSGEYKLSELISQGKNKKEEVFEAYKNLKVKPDEPCQILFTSGTSGYNKAVVLSNRNVCCSVYSALENFGRYDDTISILPFYHAYENSCHVLPAIFCGCTNHINDSLTHVVKNLKNTPAEMTVVVPMVLDTIANRIKSESRKLHAEKYLKMGLRWSRIFRVLGIDLREKWFEPVLSKVSDSLRTFVVGGAAVSTETYDLLSGLGFVIVNGYGETECAPLIACNTPDRQNRLSVGKIITDMQVKIGEKDENGNGEILVKGKGVMLGYYNDEEATKQSFDKDGWLHTGDLGHLNKMGELFICGRSKNLIILSNGKNVYPEELEILLKKKIKYIEEVIVNTDKKQKGIYANLYLDDNFTKNKTDEEIYNIVKFDVTRFNKTMPTYKYINDIKIYKEPFKKNINHKIVRSIVGDYF